MPRKNKTQEQEKTIKIKDRKPLKNPRKLISKRVNFLFFMIFALFMVLVVKLYNMQIVNKDFYIKKASNSLEQTKVKLASQRGEIFDAAGQPIATNKAIQAIQFTRGNNLTAGSMRNTAVTLAQILPADTVSGTLTKRDKQDFFLADKKNLDAVAAELTAKEKGLEPAEQYKAELQKVKATDLEFDPATEFAAKLFKAMNGTRTFDRTTIASGNISPEQQALIGEKEADLPGISVGSTWTRDYAQNDLSDLIGRVTTEKQGIPSDLLKDYLAKGYERNDRVGSSFIEQAYDDKLQGKKTEKEIIVDKKGKIESEKTLQEGGKGDNLKLTINLNFQNGVDKILSDQMNQMIAEGFGAYSTGAYAVVLDNKTGAVLAMSGLKRDPATGEIENHTLGTFQSIFPPGSVVKPATITSAWQAGVISGNQSLVSQAIQFQGSNPILDWWKNSSPMPISAVQALQYSSNTYMTQLALLMSGTPYQPDMTLSTDNQVKVFGELRKTYAEYGLGAATGFDNPGEAIGLLPKATNKASQASQLIFESFGQYDNYTPLQLAQYAATLANNGERVAPHIVEGIYGNTADGKLGALVNQVPTKVMNKVDISADNMAVLHEGMYQVVHGAPGYTTGTHMTGAAVDISAKTGTSESNVLAADGTLVPVTVNNVVGFAPSNNPQISVAVMVPNTTVTANGLTTEMNQYIMRDIVNLYQSQYGFK